LIGIYIVTLKEKYKHDEMPPYQVLSPGIKFILSVFMLGTFIVWFLVYHPDVVLDALSPIRDYRNDAAQQKIDALKLTWVKDGFYTVPEFVSVPFAIWPGTPVCAYIDMAGLEGYNPDDLIAWSEMSFNDRRLPSDEVSIMIREVVESFGSYDTAQSLVSRSALEICFKRGLRQEGSTTDQSHLLRISARDSAAHEILFYEWVIRACSCRA
jgi:hypothetical protein